MKEISKGKRDDVLEEYEKRRGEGEGGERRRRGEGEEREGREVGREQGKEG